jgi:polar amino acid transport system substrate-binding protein
LKDLTKRIIVTIAVFTIILIMVIMYAGIVPGCSQASNGIVAFKEGQLTYFDNKIIVGTDASYPPFEFIQDGEIRGFDIDIASEIASRLEKELEIVPITWDFTYKIPEDTELDMIISAVSEEEDKEEFVDFSDPYYTLEYILVVLSDAELTIKEDLKDKKVGMIDIRVKDLDPESLKSFAVEEYKEILVMMEDLRNKNIDGVIISVPFGKNIIEENNGIYTVLETIKSNKAFNIVFHKDSPLKDEVNRILDEMIQDGTYQEIYESWFLLP